MTTKTKTDIEKLLTIRTLQRDMLLFVMSAYIEARDKSTDQEIEKWEQRMRKTVALVEDELV